MDVDVMSTPLASPNLQVDPGLITRLRELLKTKEATWLSREQAKAVHLLVHNIGQHTITVLPTAGGKTLVYAIPAMFARLQGSYVVAVPNRALLEDLKRRMGEFGLDHCEWRKGSQSAFRETPVIFVSADTLCHSDFLSKLKEMSIRGALKGIIMDEAHKWAYESHYRHAIQASRRVTDLGVTIHMMTATLRPGFEDRLARTFGLQGNDFVKVRASIDKPNLEYRVNKVSIQPGQRSQAVMDQVVTDAESLSKKFEKGDLGLIIVRSVAMAQKLAQRLGCGSFHANKDGEKGSQEAYLKWQAERERENASSDNSRWICATPLIDTGNDTKGVRHTMFCEPPFDMISLLQGAGRTARDGGHGVVTVYYDRYQEGGLVNGFDKEFADVEGVRLYVENTETCRRYLLTSRWDASAVSCAENPGGALCDICQNRKNGLKELAPQLPLDVRTVKEALESRLSQIDQEKLDMECLSAIHDNVIPLGICPFHFAVEGRVVDHKIDDCNLTSRKGERMFQKQCWEFERKISWQSGFVCYHCFFTHAYKDWRFHDGQPDSCKRKTLMLNNRPGVTSFSQHSKAFLSAIYWAIYSSQELRDSAAKETGFRAIPDNLGDYYRFLTDCSDGSVLPVGLTVLARCMAGRVAALRKEGLW